MSEPDAHGWLPIETAPKDGTNILVHWPEMFHCSFTAHWNTGKWSDAPIGWKWSGWSNNAFQVGPTHWQPLPKPPISQSSGPLTPPSEPQTPAELAASCPATPDEVLLPPVQASSGPNSGGAL